MRKLFGTFVLAALILAPSQAEAQFTLGGGLAWHNDFDLGVGIWGVAPAPGIHENVSIGGDLTFFFPDADFIDYFEINANMFYSFRDTEMSFTPFLLGGLNIARISVDTDLDGTIFDFDASATEVGLNAGGGLSFGSDDGGIQPVVGAKIELGGGEGFVLFGGIGFPMGG